VVGCSTALVAATGVARTRCTGARCFTGTAVVGAGFGTRRGAWATVAPGTLGTTFRLCGLTTGLGFAAGAGVLATVLAGPHCTSVSVDARFAPGDNNI
jgi:hypothetical protein